MITPSYMQMLQQQMTDDENNQSAAQRAAAANQLAHLTAPSNPYAGGGQFMGSSDYLNAIMSNNQYQNQVNQLSGQAGILTPNQTRRAGDYDTGMRRGTEIFYNDPDMMAMRDKLIGLSKGYSGEELGALRSKAISGIEGARSKYLQNLSGNLAKQGVGGARAAAMKGAADVGFSGQRAGAEREMALDSAKMQRQGVQDLGSFLMRQKYGTLASALGEAQLGSSDYAAEQQAKAASKGDSGPCCFIFLEARYGNGTMDKVVRRFRDENMTDKNKRGYYKLSEVLIPFMRKSKLVKGLVRMFMTDPMVSYGKYHYGEGKIGFIFKPVANFWLKTFEYLGGDHQFIRENGEVV